MQQQESAGYFVGSERAGRTVSAPGVGSRCMSARMTPRVSGTGRTSRIDRGSEELRIGSWVMLHASCFVLHAHAHAHAHARVQPLNADAGSCWLTQRSLSSGFAVASPRKHWMKP